MSLDRLGAACDFLIVGLESGGNSPYGSTYRLVDWILEQQLPFDSLYYYGSDQPIHISDGSQQKRDLWTFTDKGQPTKRGVPSVKQVPAG